MALTTITGSGTQTTTQTPQAAGAPSATGTQSSSVQPGTATSVLTSQGGVPLTNTPLSTVSLSATTQTATPAIPPPRHINLLLMGVSVVLLLIAVAMFWATSRSVKNTTEY